ncbi:MAG: protocatechuate 3,4-dioxygenase [Thiolinea sp.]
MAIKKMREIPGTTFFDGPMSTKGYPINKMFYSFNSAEGREGFAQDEEAYMEKFRLTEAQRQAVRDRDVLGMIREGGSIYYLAKIGPLLKLNVQDFGGLQTGRTTEEFQAYLDSQGVGKHNG